VRILLLGVSHRSAPLEVRERLAVDDPAPVLQKLVRDPEIEEAVLFSTCNRVEIVALTRHAEAARHRLRACFRQDLARGEPLPGGAELESHLYEHVDGEALRHVLRVACALDSMVVGEPQILGQTKDAYRTAVECGACGPILGRLFERAFSAAKRVRAETGVAERPVSVARVAVALARQIFEDLEHKAALLVGAGEMIEAALQALLGEGLSDVRVANRSPERAAELAVRFGATAHGLGELPGLLARSDLVLTSIAAERPLLTPELVGGALRGRGHRPMFVIDIGVPRNVDPAVDRLDGVYLYDIDDLGALASENAEKRRRETARAEAIVAEEQQRFDGWFAALRAVPTIRHLRERVEALRSAEVERALRRGDSLDREGVERLTHSLVNKILHAPVSRLRRVAEREEGMAYLEAARVLFDLDRTQEGAPDGGPGAEAPSGDPDPE
jgi:glutamyl-tRNA reductase